MVVESKSLLNACHVPPEGWLRVTVVPQNRLFDTARLAEAEVFEA